MTDPKEELAQKIQEQIVGVKHRSEDGQIAVVERVNSSHPSMEIGLFVNYRNNSRDEWITPEELKSRLDSGEWSVWDGGN